MDQEKFSTLIKTARSEFDGGRPPYALRALIEALEYTLPKTDPIVLEPFPAPPELVKE